MRRLGATITTILIVLSCPLAAHAFSVGTGGIPPVSPGGTYAEVGDAGDHSTPQAIAGVDISTITGDVGGAGDPSDAFRFFFAGGGIAFVGTATFPTTPTTSDLIPLPLSLFPDLGHPPDPAKPDFEDLAGSVIGFLALGAGNYIIEGTYLTDPPFTIQVFTINPDGSPDTSLQLLQPPTAVPGPASALVLALGLVGLWTAGRSFRRR